MHVVYFLHSVANQEFWTHGAGNYVSNIARIMVEHGHRASIIIENEEEKSFEWNGISIYYIQAAKGFKNTGEKMPTHKKVLKNICRSVRYNRKVLEINRTIKVDIVQSVDVYGLILLRRSNIPYIVRRSGYSSLWMEAEKENFDYRSAYKTDKRPDIWLTQYAVKRADRIVAPSRLVADITQDKTGRPVTVIESPVSIPNQDKLILSEEGLTENNFFVTFGANTNRKCIRMLAEKIDDILEKYPDMKYVVIGNDRVVSYMGERQKSSVVYEKNVQVHKNRFIFINGIADKERLFSIVKYAKCCILPTRMDNLPNAVLEAMALGKIVISTTSEYGTSAEQLITDGENGFLAQVDNAEDLLKKIDVVMNLSVDEKVLIEQKAKERVKDLTPEKVYEKMIQIYEECIDLYDRRN